MGEKTNRLAIYLIKPEITEFDKIIEPDANALAIEGVGTLFVEKSKPHQPDWVADFFREKAPADLGLVVSSAKAVLLVKVTHKEVDRLFAIAFGQGRHFLLDSVIEERFGLKVVLNTVKEDSLRSIDKTALASGVPKQSREQISREGAASSFGIDFEQDLVNAVTGHSGDLRFGKIISGRDSLPVSAKFDVTDVTDLLLLALAQSESDHYLKSFDWIDQIKHIRDQAITEPLENRLIEKLNSGDLDKVWMAPPEVVNWVDVKGFRYSKSAAADIHDDVDIQSFLDTFEGAPATIEALSKKKILVLSAKNDSFLHQWPAFKCIYAEIEHNDKIWLLNNGKWYQIAKNFAEQVLKSFEDMPESDLELIDYNHDNEGTYNIALAQAINGSCCMDAKNIVYGGGHSKVEFCDVLTADNRLIHIKRYSGSSQLSHHFAQGTVSGELFLQDASFRKLLNEQLPNGHKLADVDARPDPKQYEIVFAIISKSDNPLEIPFFSKVILRNAKRRLEGYQFRVTKKKIKRAG